MESKPIKIIETLDDGFKYEQDARLIGYVKSKDRTIVQAIDEYDLVFIYYSTPSGRYQLKYEGIRPQDRFDRILSDVVEEKDLESKLNKEIQELNEQQIRLKEKAEEAVTKQNLKTLNIDEYIDTYVEHGKNIEARQKITESIPKWPTLKNEMILYRGQKQRREITTQKDYFFSTSSVISVATGSDFFDKNVMCCLFVLHVQPGVKYYEIPNKPTRDFEYEVLLEGNGIFYTDKQQTSRGFRQLTFEEAINRKIIGIDEYTPEDRTQNVGVFEAYYFPPTTGGRKRRKTNKKKNRRRQTKRRI